LIRYHKRSIEMCNCFFFFNQLSIRLPIKEIKKQLLFNYQLHYQQNLDPKKYWVFSQDPDPNTPKKLDQDPICRCCDTNYDYQTLPITITKRYQSRLPNGIDRKETLKIKHICMVRYRYIYGKF
jgi:hypothetical protein